MAPQEKPLPVLGLSSQRHTWELVARIAATAVARSVGVPIDEEEDGLTLPLCLDGKPVTGSIDAALFGGNGGVIAIIVEYKGSTEVSTPLLVCFTTRTTFRGARDEWFKVGQGSAADDVYKNTKRKLLSDLMDL